MEISPSGSVGLFYSGGAGGVKLGLEGPMAIDSSGNLYFVQSNFESTIAEEFDSALIAKISPEGVASVFASASSLPSSTSQPEGIAVDLSGNIYISDSTTNTILNPYFPDKDGSRVTILYNSKRDFQRRI
jgi:hypothetical protein